MSEPFIGQISMFAGNFAPRGWALCDGQILPIAQNTALFSILGTTYGGNGQTTFALPDLRGRAPLHQGQGPGLTARTLGESSGTETVSLLQTEMPPHNHLIGVSNQPGTVSDPTNAIAAMINTGTARSPTTSAMGFATSAQTGTLNPATCSPSGGGQPHANMQPYLCINFIIALEGVFPSRN